MGKSAIFLTCSSIIGRVKFPSISFRMFSMVHAEVSPMPIQRKDGSDAVLWVDVDVSGLGKGQV